MKVRDQAGQRPGHAGVADQLALVDHLNRLLARSLAQRGYLDVLKRRVPLYRLNDLGLEAIAVAAEEA